MKRSIISIISIMTFCSISLIASAVGAADDNKLSVSVAFGRGLNTALPGNSVNHVIIPDEIKVKEGGVVHFLVSGFHQLAIYTPGTGPENIVPAAVGPFVNDPVNVLHLGISPQGGPLGTPFTSNPSNDSNRVESFSFAAPGTYLVICNVAGHFADGMFGTVKVTK